MEHHRKLPKSSMSSSSSSSSRSGSTSPRKVRSASQGGSKRKKSPPQKDGRDGSSHGSSRSSKLPLPLPRPHHHHHQHQAYGSNYSWDSAQGQAFMDKVTARSQSASSIQPQPQQQDGKDAPYLALVQLFNQFQGMPVDTKKTLVNVTVLGSTGPLRMLVTSDATAKEVIKMALLKYAHEGRVPSLGRSTREFELYDSQFSSQALKHDDRVADLGTRNFVLCPLNLKNSCGEEESKTSSSSSSRSSWWSYVTGIKSLV